jgi:hypothetical protein
MTLKNGLWALRCSSFLHREISGSFETATKLFGKEIEGMESLFPHLFEFGIYDSACHFDFNLPGGFCFAL